MGAFLEPLRSSQSRANEPWTQVIAGLVLGSREFVLSLNDKAQQSDKVREQLRRRPAWSEIVSTVEEVKGAAWKDFAEHRGDFGRDQALFLARRLTGMTLPELGKAAAGMSGMAVSLAVKRFAQKLAAAKQLRKATATAENLLFNVDHTEQPG